MQGLVNIIARKGSQYVRDVMEEAENAQAVVDDLLREGVEEIVLVRQEATRRVRVHLGPQAIRQIEARRMAR